MSCLAAAIGSLVRLLRARRNRVAITAIRRRPAITEPTIIPANAPLDNFEEDDAEFCGDA